jgi:DNA helicase-2/ATP-dependent DNA helicase PcrA
MSDPFALDDDEPVSPAAAPATPASTHQPRGLAEAPRPAPIPAATPWLDTLNPEQREAAETIDGPVLVLAGAGTGKTRVLTTRLTHILLMGKARPWNCLAVTFTNKAANEMRSRVSQLVGASAEQMWLGTFHALCARILRRHAELVGLRSNFTILDADDQQRLLKQVLETEGVDTKRWPPQAIMGAIQRWKDRGLAPSAVPPGDASKLANGKGLDIYRDYQRRLLAVNACDFGDLLLHTLTIFQDPKYADILEQYQEQFRYILVDEYQDTNVAQYLWLRLLARKHKNICCVGDDDQSVYSWRGAEVGNILKFERDFPGAKVIRLEANYRSTPPILKAASHLIAHNSERLGKTLRPAGGGTEGDAVIVRGVWDGEEEARWVVEEIEALQRKGMSLGEIAVLVRAGFQTREFEERLVATGVPYKVVGGLRFYERAEIRDAIAYFRVVVQPADDLAFERIVNTPKRGLGDSAMQAMHQLANAQRVPLTEAAREIAGSDELKAKPKASLARLLADFARWRALLPVMPHQELARLIIEESGYGPMWRAQKTPEAQGRTENLKELVAAIEEFESLPTFLEHVALVMENEEKSDQARVTLMTLHAAKGLEFDGVFLPGWEEGLFPHPRALQESGEKALEEERRLAYVGLTRARKRAFVSHAANRRVYNQWQHSLPSRFIEELPEEAVERTAAQGLFGGAPDQATAWAQHGMGGQPWRVSPRQDYRSPHGQNFSTRPSYTPPSGGGPAESRTPAASSVSESGFKTGERVFHQKFGYGRVVAIEGNKLEIQFEKAGPKKIIDSFVSAA